MNLWENKSLEPTFYRIEPKAISELEAISNTLEWHTNWFVAHVCVQQYLYSVLSFPLFLSITPNLNLG